MLKKKILLILESFASQPDLLRELTKLVEQEKTDAYYEAHHHAKQELLNQVKEALDY